MGKRNGVKKKLNICQSVNEVREENAGESNNTKRTRTGRAMSDNLVFAVRANVSPS